MSRLLLLAFLALAAPVSAARAETDAPAFLFTYFTGNGEDGLHLAWSEDGYHWTALNGGRSVLTPKVGKDRLMRDPCITRGPDGTYHLVWTTGWWDNTIGHAATKDFITWTDQQAIPVMAHEPGVRNSWAPEAAWDAKRRQFLVFWASTVRGKFTATAGTSEDDLNHRLYCTTTKDWATLTPTRLFCDPGFSVIDATLLPDGEGAHHLIVKDETVKPPKKHLRIAASTDLEGPWENFGPPFTRDWVEGPTAIKAGGTNVVYYDVYRERHYGAVRSRDLEHWEDVSDQIALPAGARHGTMIAVPRSLIDGLQPAGAEAATNLRHTYDFNPGWKLRVGDPEGASAPDFDDSDWKPVTLPRAWNEDDAFRRDIKELPTGIAWYRKAFTLPAGAAGGKVFLEFEGIRQAGEFFLNGQPLGRHENGVMACGLDISRVVRPAPAVNVIAVRTDNDWEYREQATGQRYQWADRNFNANYGGIPKNVRLHVAGRLYQTLPLFSNLGTTGVYIHATEMNVGARSATITAESEIKNETAASQTFRYEVSVADAERRGVRTFTGEPMTVAAGATTVARASARVEGLNFWSWGYGYLYTVSTTLLVDDHPVDVVRTRTGFRQTEFAQGELKLNGRVLLVHGYAQRTSNEWPALGLSVPPWLSDFSNRLMVESGGNLVRWMHVTPWKQDVESCDRVGLMQAMPAGDSERDASGRQWAQRVEVMRDAIIYNRNHPSILFYECGNKGISEEHMVEMRALRDRYDPHGGRAIGAREMLGSRAAEFGGEMLYVNKSARQPFWAMEYSRDEGARKFWDEFSPPFHPDGEGPLYKGQDARAYNRNQDSHAREDVVRWYDFWRERPGTGTRVSAGGVNIVFSDSNTHHRGAENFRRSGEVDAMRIPKDGFFAHQVMWDGWVEPERPRLHLLGHWNYAAGVNKTVTAVSSADRVELWLNGRSLGLGRCTERFLFTFPDVNWAAGTLRAVGYDSAGREICADERVTAGPPTALRLHAWTAPEGLRADGADAALVQVEVVDAQGRRCPTALNLVNFELAGEAEWRGGIAQGPGNFVLERSLPVEGGVNRVLLRTTTTPGAIRLTARSVGLQPAEITLSSRGVTVAGGLGATLPGEALRSDPVRGPTPAGASFTISRVAVPVARVTAGSNAAGAEASCDDDETTAWSSDNELAGGWIEFELTRPAQLTAAAFRLTGWRQRSYPIRITLDGAEVFRGATAKNLGYVTLALAPARGQKVRIELLDPSTNQDAFRLVELGNKNENASTGADRVGDRTLSIVEAEFYEAPVTPAPELAVNSSSSATPLIPGLPTVFVAGDSTAAKGSGAQQQGWGEFLGDYFDPTKVNVVNRARGGRSSRTFITEGLWDQLLALVKPGDVVLIQFGHNDAGAINAEPPGSTRPLRARGTLPGTGDETEAIDNVLTKQPEVVHTFGWYLRKMIADTRAKGATPIVLSLTVRNMWAQGKVERGSGEYRAWSREVAAAAGVPWVDVSRIIADQYQQIGESKVKEFFPQDHTHTTAAGANLNAASVAAGLKGLRDGPWKEWLSAKGRDVTADPIGWLNLPEPANADRPTLMLIGDSTVRNGRGDGAGGQWGWGDSLPGLVDTGKLNVVNRAIGGLSSRTFLTGGHWDRALTLLRSGDFLLLQFGHNDNGAINDTSRARGTLKGTGEETEDIDNLLTRQHEVVHTYGWYLRRYVRDARARGVTPIVCSPVPRKQWRDGRIVRSADTYAGWARQVAQQEGVAFIDLNELVAQRYDAIGPIGVDALFADEHTHTSKAGADLAADVVATALRELPGASWQAFIRPPLEH